MATQIGASKMVSESLDVSFDMLSRCTQGETIVTAIVNIVVSSGIDPTPEDMIEGITTVSNNIATQRVGNGLPGVIYDVVCAARSSLNNIFINTMKLAVLSDNALVPPEA